MDQNQLQREASGGWPARCAENLSNPASMKRTHAKELLSISAAEKTQRHSERWNSGGASSESMVTWRWKPKVKTGKFPTGNFQTSLQQHHRDKMKQTLASSSYSDFQFCAQWRLKHYLSWPHLTYQRPETESSATPIETKWYHFHI